MNRATYTFETAPRNGAIAILSQEDDYEAPEYDKSASSAGFAVRFRGVDYSSRSQLALAYRIDPKFAKRVGTLLGLSWLEGFKVALAYHDAIGWELYATSLLTTIPFARYDRKFFRTREDLIAYCNLPLRAVTSLQSRWKHQDPTREFTIFDVMESLTTQQEPLSRPLNGVATADIMSRVEKRLLREKYQLSLKSVPQKASGLPTFTYPKSRFLFEADRLDTRAVYEQIVAPYRK